ncbi:heme peroxidase [Halomonas sp. SH5A2]|uniref:peroxidase family protein n=1 Tax=Halomonas sp. SH5A2 TaxID=2749040 RepID=UPI00163FB35D|nr:peroxidase family protein [Halomonas sp. SH5A2]QNI02547.1 heme peroxidase [Halomonas sp. SH5A2]
MAVKMNQHDLQFILDQIKIAEAHAAGESLAELVGSSLLPYGLRTVDGSYNNFVVGREQWGASGEPFGPITEGSFPVGSGALPVGSNYPTNNDYGENGHVVDAEPRLISNLIVDQTLDNPAAIATALQHAGMNGQPMLDAVGEIRAQHELVRTLDEETPEYVTAKGELDTLLASYEIEMDGSTIMLPNAAPDEGLSASYNAIFTLFGQFFDHGLDMVSKGGNGTVFMPLSPDDPLYNPASPHTNFMVMTRATTGEAAANVTTPWVDQNQTYTSNPSHQVFLREYIESTNGPVASGRLLNGDRGLATWGDVKEQARVMLGIELTDMDVSAVPELLVDPYGEFIRGDNGLPQILAAFRKTGEDEEGNPVLEAIYVEGNRQDPVNPSAISLLAGTEIYDSTSGENRAVAADETFSAARTSNAFLDDIAHAAVVVTDNNGALVTDVDDVAGNSVAMNNRGQNTEYDDELLNAHYITGDGRGNENIGLTAIHHIFHSEHNRLAEQVKEVVLESGDLDFLNQWLSGAELTSWPSESENLSWDGERIFQAARFTTEMEYQHLVFEEFARKIQPDIDIFNIQIGNVSSELNPVIFSEFAHVVYRFGHSMLNETVDRIDVEGNRSDMDLFEAFLNPLAFGSETVSHEEAAGAILRGMSAQTGNEIDEFVTNTLRNQLLGIPLDLAAINIARGRDTGMPTLNDARAQFMEIADGDTQLRPYTSWADFAENMKNPASLVNFIAAYGTHDSITEMVDDGQGNLREKTLEEKRDAAMQLVGLSDPTETIAASVENASFEMDSLASGESGVITHANGNYTTAAPTGWTLTGQGGLIAPAAGVVDETGIEGTNVAWLRESGMLSQATGQTLEEGDSYRLTLDIGDRTNMDWPGGEARLVAGGVVLATVSLTAPAEDGGWATFSFDTGTITAAQADQELSIEIQQTGGGSNQILIDNVRLDVERPTEITDRLDFLNSTGAWSALETGLNNIDLWVGGLAEKKMPFGGMLGSTFAFVFEMQLENLQDADRFYYLSRTQGLNLLSELENNSLAKMALANTDLGETGFALSDDIFSTPDNILYVDPNKQSVLTGLEDPQHEDPFLQSASQLVERGAPDAEGNGAYLRYNGADHVLIQGTEGNDRIVAGGGDDTVRGGAGDDRIEAGYGVDKVDGGEGDDIITNSGTDIGAVDMFKGDEGNDVIHGGSGMALIFGGRGKDFLVTGPDGSEIRAGMGDDFLLGGDGMDILFGNEGNDWVEGKGRFDYIAGDNGDIFFNSTIIGHDIINGGQGDTDYDGDSGDDIMVASEGVQKNIGMWGHDWVIHKGQMVGADADMNVPVFASLPVEVLRDRFSQVEALSGWVHDDILRGDNRSDEENDVTPLIADPTPEGNFVHNELDQAGIARIEGLGELITPEMMRDAEYWADGSGTVKSVFTGGNILLGGGGSDEIEGRGGDDIIDGDAWLNVRISIRENLDGTGTEIASVDSMGGLVTLNIGGTDVTKTLTAWMVEGQFNPGQLQIVREILKDDSGTDKALYWDDRAAYEITADDDNGRLTVAHVDVDDGAFDPVNGKNRVSDGTDLVSNIEVLSFGDGDIRVFTGTSGNDVGTTRLDGTDGDDILIGLAGNDNLLAAGGDDLVFGGAGDDRLIGADGDDTLDGGEGNDFLNGQDGNDVLLGGAGDDNLTGGLGDDLLEGGDGNDILNATAGNDSLLGGAGNDNLNGGGGDDVLNGGAGDDVLFGSAHDDLLITEADGGRDILDGGNHIDTAEIRGSADEAETFAILDRANAEARNFTNLAAGTEIVIVRNGLVMAELANIEEIVIDGQGGGDSFEIAGNFTGTSLAMSTIHVMGSEDDDVLDISALSSAHRVVFKTQGGHDTVVGELREQDVVELADGTTLAEMAEGLEGDGEQRVGDEENSVSFEAVPEVEQPVEGDTSGGDDTEEEDETVDESEVEEGEDDDVAPTPVSPIPVAAMAGSEVADALVGTADSDTIMALGDRDVVFGHDGDDDIFGGDGADMLYGDDGDDRILGEDGNDFINAGAGDDTVFGGDGDDLFVAEADDGDDTYYGDDMVGGTGSDTLDMSAITAAITADLGTGFMGRGSVSSTQTGNDGLWGVENIVTGSGDDTITANHAANVMDGGAGNDTFRFHSAADADGDTLMGFQPGDRIDLSGIDANGCASDNQSFTLVNEAFTGAGQLMFSHQTLDGEDYTVVQGNTTGGDDDDFSISIKGRHELGVNDFNL